MAQVKFHKYVAALPAQLEPNAIYYVRAGDGFDTYVTNGAGTIVAYPANTKWDVLKSPAIASGALTIDLSSPAGFRVALSQNVTSVSFANVPSGRVVVFTITWVQDATGGRTVAFPSNVRADGGGTPAQPATGPNAVTVQTFYTDNGGATVWHAAGIAPLDVLSGQIGAALTGTVPGPLKVPFSTFWTKRGGIQYDVPNRRFYLPKAGIYRAVCNVQAEATPTRLILGFNTDAPGLANNHRGQAYTDQRGWTIQVNGVFEASAGDYIVFYVAQGAIYNDGVQNQWGQFSIEYMGAAT